MIPNEFLKKLKQGDASAFECLVDQYKDRVLNLCYRFVNNREDAQDVSQDVFVEVFRSVRDFRGEAKLSTWIHSIAVAKSLDFIRKKNRKKRFGQIKQLLGLDEAARELIAPKRHHPEVLLEAHECQTILRQAVEALSEKQRIAVIMNKYEGFSYAEVADVMGTTVSAVDSLIQRGMKHLRKKLDGYYREAFRD